MNRYKKTKIEIWVFCRQKNRTMWLREVSKEKYKDTVEDVSAGTNFWPFLSNKWFANHRMQQSKAKGL